MIQQSDLYDAVSYRAENAIPWKVIVIGAGPAGGLISALLAQQGLEVLLVDAKEFPRDKVCGGCLNLRSLSVLSRCGLTEKLSAMGAVPISHAHLLCNFAATNPSAKRPTEATVSLPGGLAVSRRAMDEMMVHFAIENGVTFSDRCTATVLPQNTESGVSNYSSVRLKFAGHAPIELKSEIVIAADGLNQSSLKELPEFHSVIRGDSRVGLGVIVASANAECDQAYPPGRITMSTGQYGYVGVTRVEDNNLNIAAAVDAAALKVFARPNELLSEMLQVNRLPVPPDLLTAAVAGTPPMTRLAPQIAGRRILVIGDATGYVEPFTGEGMAWALSSAEKLADMIAADSGVWENKWMDQWRQIWQRNVADRQHVCRTIIRISHHPRIANFAVKAAAIVPSAASMVVKHFNKH